MTDDTVTATLAEREALASPAFERGPYADLGSNRMSRRRDKTRAKERARHARAARREAREGRLADG